MKLYTEEQVRNMLSGAMQNHWVDEFLLEYIPIELPSDEEIEKESDRYLAPHAFREGAKWVIEQIEQ